jgi:hypothetical protein
MYLIRQCQAFVPGFGTNTSNRNLCFGDHCADLKSRNVAGLHSFADSTYGFEAVACALYQALQAVTASLHLCLSWRYVRCMNSLSNSMDRSLLERLISPRPVAPCPFFLSSVSSRAKRRRRDASCASRVVRRSVVVVSRFSKEMKHLLGQCAY